MSGHEFKRVVPVLQDHYLHGQPKALVSQQLNARALFQPPVRLPVYVRGQFASLLARREDFHP